MSGRRVGVHFRSAMLMFLVVVMFARQRLFASDLIPFFSSSDSQWGYLDSCFDVAIKPSFARAWNFQEGLANVIVDRQVEFIDENGHVVLNLPNFDSPSGFFSEGLLNYRAETGNKLFGYLSREGKSAIAPQFDRAEPFSEGFAAVKRAGKWFFIGVDGNKAFDGQFENVGNFSGGFAWVELDGKVGFIDHKGGFIVPPAFSQAESFREGLAAVLVGKLWGFISSSGKLVIPPRFDRVQHFSEGLAAVQKGFLWGYIDHGGKFTIGPKFPYATDFHEGLAAVDDVSTWKTGYIDQRGVMQVPSSFALAEPFRNGIARVHWPDKSNAHGWGNWGYIDRQGMVIWTALSGRSPRYVRAGCPERMH